MYNTISVDRSLFFINESRVTTFKEVASRLAPNYELNLEGAICNEDVWTTVFNLWLLSHPDDMLILESIEKTFYYSTNYVVYDYLKNDYHFNFIRNHPKKSNELYFIFSIYLTNNLNAYWYELLVNNGLKGIVLRNAKRSYFEAHHTENEALASFIEDQSKFIKVLMNDIKTSEALSEIIKTCCNNALNDYEHYSTEQLTL